MSALSEALANLMENPEAKAFLSKLKGGPLSEETEGALNNIKDVHEIGTPSESNSIPVNEQSVQPAAEPSPIASEEMSNQATDYFQPEPDESKQSMSPIAKKALIAAGIGGGAAGTGALLMGGGGGQPPFPPSSNNATPPAEGETQQPQAAVPKQPVASKARMPSGTPSANMGDIKARQDAAIAKLGPETSEELPSQSLLNFGSADQNKNELADVQQRQNMAELVNRLGKAGAYIGAGIARTPVVAPDEFDKNIAAAKNITQQYLDRKANEENDPNSGISKAFRDYVKKFGVNVTDGASAGQLKQVVPYIFKDFEAKQAQENHKQDIELQQQNRKDIADQKSQDLRLRYAELAANKQIAQANREDKEDQQNQFKVQQQMESVRGDKALQNAKETIRRVASAENILSQYPDLNKVPNNISNMIMTDLGTIVTGGVLGHEGFKEIANPTLYSKLSEKVQELGNSPTGAQLGAFLKQTRNLLQELSSTAESQVEDKYRRILNTSGRTLKPNTREIYRDTYLPNDEADKTGKYSRKQHKKSEAVPIFDPNAAAAELARRQKGNQ